MVTEETAYLAEYYLGKPLQLSIELLGTERVCVGDLQMMVSAVWDRGATDWHRDYSSNVLAPLEGVQKDMAATGVPYAHYTPRSTASSPQRGTTRPWRSPITTPGRCAPTTTKCRI